MDVDDFEKHYYKLSVILLTVIGLWPGDSTVLGRIQRVIWSFMIIFSLIIQILPFVTMEYANTLVLTNVPTIIAVMGSAVKYFTFVVQNNDIKDITELIKDDWTAIKDDEEAKIFMLYAGVGRFRATAFATLYYLSLIVFLLSQYTPWFLDLLAPLNETRSLHLFMTIELFLDQQRYFHVILFAFSVVCITTVTVYVATETANMMWLEHQVSQFEIYAYRMRKVFLGDPVETHVVHRNEIIVEMLASAVDMHNRAIVFNIYVNKFLWSYFLLLCIGVTSLTIILYRLSIALKNMDNFEELAMCAVLYVPVLGYMCYVNYVEQRVLNSYNSLHDAIYDTNWYAATVGARKMLLFVMLRNMQPLKRKLYGMYDRSMGGFMEVMKLTFSYYLMLHSML